MPDVVLDTVHSPDNKRSGARNMWRIGINMYEKRTVLQVGYLQELNRDALRELCFKLVIYKN